MLVTVLGTWATGTTSKGMSNY